MSWWQSLPPIFSNITNMLPICYQYTNIFSIYYPNIYIYIIPTKITPISHISQQKLSQQKLPQQNFPHIYHSPICLGEAAVRPVRPVSNGTNGSAEARSEANGDLCERWRLEWENPWTIRYFMYIICVYIYRYLICIYI